MVSPRNLCSVIEKAANVGETVTKSSRKTEAVKSLNSSQESIEESNICSICLGVFLFSYRDEKDMLVEKDHMEDFATTIVDTVKGDYHEISDFTLEVSLPTLITENEQLIMSYMKNKYASEAWFQEKFSSEHISVKDALKLLMTLALTSLPAKFGDVLWVKTGRLFYGLPCNWGCRIAGQS